MILIYTVKKFHLSLFFAPVFLFLHSCQSKQTSSVQVLPSRSIDTSQLAAVKSVLLYDTILKYPIDTILIALQEVNDVIATIEPQDAGYSLWKVQSDSIPDYRYLIEGKWPSQASFDRIHENSDFRLALR